MQIIRLRREELAGWPSKILARGFELGAAFIGSARPLVSLGHDNLLAAGESLRLAAIHGRARLRVATLELRRFVGRLRLNWRPGFTAVLALCGFVSLAGIVSLRWATVEQPTMANFIPSPDVISDDEAEQPSTARPLGRVEIRNPTLQFALDMPASDRVPVQHRLFQDGFEVRDEVINWGSAADGAFHAQITLRRFNGVTTGAGEEPLFVATVRAAAGSGLALTRIATPTALPTKFGEFETAEAQVATEDAMRSCLVFRRRDGTGDFQISGWYCGAADRLADRPALSCFLDRLELVAPGDPSLRQVFATAERRRQRCPDGGWDNGARRNGLASDEQGPPVPTFNPAAKKSRPASRSHNRKLATTGTAW